MKIARTLGLAVFTAMALMASLGAGSAAAAETTLCKTGTTSPICPSGDSYSSATSIKAEATESFVIENLTTPVTCKESRLEGKTSAAAGNPLPLKLSSWMIGKCGPCTVTAEEADETGSILWSTGGNGTLNANASWHVVCKFFGFPVLDCTFGFDSDTTLQGGNPAQLAVPKTTLSRSGSMCPGEATLNAVNYSVSSPKPAYVAKTEEPGTELCKAKETPCAGGNKYTKGTLIEAESDDFVINTWINSYTCDEASLAVATQLTMGDPLPVQLTSFDLEGCYGSGVGNCNVTTTALTPEEPSAIAWDGEFNGELSNLAVSWKFACGPLHEYVATFKSSWGLYAQLNGGSPATFGYIQYPLYCVGVCPEEGKLSADFTVTSPNPLYVGHW